MGALSARDLSGILKTGVLIVGVMVLIVGCHAFFESEWNRTVFQQPVLNGTEVAVAGGHIYLHCLAVAKNVEERKNATIKYKNDTKKDHPGFQLYAKCPIIESYLEYYFIVIAIICFICSIVSLSMTLFTKGSMTFKKVDSYYHLVAGVLLLIAGIINIIAAVNIKGYVTRTVARQLPTARAAFTYEEDQTDHMQFFRGKVTAGVFTIINSGMYLGAGIVGRQL